MSKELLSIQPKWKETGAALVVAHPDDEVLFWSLAEHLC